MKATDVRQPPASIGQAFCFASFKQQDKSNTLITETEDGTPLKRRRFTNHIVFAEVSVNLKAELYDDFMTFTRVTLRDNLDAFWLREPSKRIAAWSPSSVPDIQWSSGAEVFSITWTLFRDESWPVK